MVRWLISAAFLGASSILCFQDVSAQYIIRHQSPVAFERSESNRVEFDATGFNQVDILQASLFYRYDGDFSYQQQEIDFQNGRFSLLLDITDRSASSIEYYLEVELSSGEILTYPENTPSENPVQVEIVDTVKEALPELEEVEFTILSPRQGNGLREEDVVVAIALFYDPTILPEGEFKLLFDGTDVTADADTSAFYISYVPESVPLGSHSINLQYQTSDITYSVTEWQFFTVSPGQATFQGFQAAGSRAPSGQVELTARNQVIAGDVNNAYTGRTRISGQYGKLNYSVNGYLTSQESDRLQPQNRYGINLSMGNWWKFEAGHVYPSMSKFTISGRRVHGVNTSLHLLFRNLNFQFIYGELDRKISNLYDELVISEETTAAGIVVDTSYTLTYQNQGRGGFQRNIIGGRIGLGNPEKFQFGLHALKIRDDTTSLVNIRDFNTLTQAKPSLGSDLSTADRNKLEQNPNLLRVQGGTAKPRDNIVAGSDLKFGFHQNRIRFETEAVISALNDDIYGGPLNVERADEMGFEISQEDADFLERLSWLIIINENFNTIPLRITEDENGNDETEAFFPTSILATSSELSARYPKNNFRLQYRWIGPNFNSLANSTIRKDVDGITITDRLNLFANRIYFTLGYEWLQDNVVGNRDATTHTYTYRTNVSWYPVSRDLPRVTAGIRYRTRDNGVERQNFEVISPDFIPASIRNQRINANGDTVSTVFPRLNNTINLNTSVSQQFNFFDVRHDASLNFTTLKTTDEAFAYGDVKSTALSLNLTSRFTELSLQSQFGITYNSTESGGGQNNISIFGMYAGGEHLTLEGKLSLNGRIAFTLNKTESAGLEIRDNLSSDELDDNPLNDYYVLGDEVNKNSYGTFVFQAGAEYNFNEYHALVFEANITNVTYVNASNDRIVQFRYVFNF